MSATQCDAEVDSERRKLCRKLDTSKSAQVCDLTPVRARSSCDSDDCLQASIKQRSRLNCLTLQRSFNLLSQKIKNIKITEVHGFSAQMADELSRLRLAHDLVRAHLFDVSRAEATRDTAQVALLPPRAGEHLQLA